MSQGPYTVAWAIQKAYTRATNHTDILSTSSTTYLKLLQFADDFQRDWQDEPGVMWNSLWNQFTVGTIEQGVFAYTITGLTPPIRTVSKREEDKIILRQLSGANAGESWYYDFIAPDKLTDQRYRQSAAVVQGQLYFANDPEDPAFPANDARIGATILVPGYGYVDDITSGSQIIEVDDPMWLVYMMAAELVRTDFVRQNQYPNLLQLANNKMEGMRQKNETGLEEIDVDIDLFDIEPNVGLSSGAWY